MAAVLPNTTTEFRRDSKPVFMSHTIRALPFEKWVQKVAKLSGQQVDWGFIGGRAIVRYVGDREKVIQAINDLKAAHDAIYIKELSKLGLRPRDCPPPWYFIEDSGNLVKPD